MKKIAVFYWPKKGNVEFSANRIFKKFEPGTAELHSIDEIDHVNLNDLDLIIVGGSTVGAIVWEKADDNNLWFDFFAKCSSAELTDKLYAIFGLGDQVLYPENFVDGMMLIKNEFDGNGAKLIGKWPVDGYKFTGSAALDEDEKMFVGLALDEDNQDELTEQRIEKWVKQVKEEAKI